MGFFGSGLTETPLDDLVATAQSSPENDTAATSQIVARFHGLAMRQAAGMTRCEATRLDLVQVQLVAVLAAVRHHDGRPGFASYCRQYMRGAALREVRGDRFRTTSLDDETNPEVVGLVAPYVQTGSQAWGVGRVGQAIAALPARQQELLRHRYIEDQPLKAIAAGCGTSVPAVSQRLATAHRGVATRLAA